MAKQPAHQTWTVLPHGALEQLDDNLWTVVGSLPSMPLKRVMTVVKLPGDEVLVHNPIALEDMAPIEALGRISQIVVPNGWHRLDAKLFANRYPTARVMTAVKSVRKVREVVSRAVEVIGVPTVALSAMPGTRELEVLTEITSAGGLTLVFGDVIFNMPHQHGVKGFVLKHVLQSSGPPHVSRIGRLFLIKDKRAFKAKLLELAARDPVRAIVAHHEVIARPAAVLREIAASL